MIVLELFYKGLFAGLAAIGFSILFNVPSRTLPAIGALACIGGIIKFSCLNMGINIILSSLLGATTVGILSIITARRFFAAPLIFSIPAVIPMVPGAFAYNMMLGFIDLTVINNDQDHLHTLLNTVNNGLNALFIVMSLAFGVAIPMLMARKESIKKIEHNK